LDLDRHAVFVARPVDPDLVADEERGEQTERPDPFDEFHPVPPCPRDSALPLRLAQPLWQRQTGTRSRLDPGRVLSNECPARSKQEGIVMPGSSEERLQARTDLAWSIAVGGIGVVLFIAVLALAWYFAATLFLNFAGMLLGVALNAMTGLLGRVVP